MALYVASLLGLAGFNRLHPCGTRNLDVATYWARGQYGILVGHGSIGSILMGQHGSIGSFLVGSRGL